MPAHQLVPAVTAGTVTALVLLLRWAATRARRQGASSARPPWRRTASSHRSAFPTRDPAGPDEQAEALLQEAEEYVHRHWQRLRTQRPPHE